MFLSYDSILSTIKFSFRSDIEKSQDIKAGVNKTHKVEMFEQSKCSEIQATAPIKGISYVYYGQCNQYLNAYYKIISLSFIGQNNVSSLPYFRIYLQGSKLPELWD